jgi:casein kinase II subunit beta
MSLTAFARLDGAYFGTTFPHMLFQVYPYYLPAKTSERYVPRIFGFRIHPSAYAQPVQRPTREGEELPTVP